MSEQVLNVAWSWLRVFLSAVLTYVLAGLASGTPLVWQAVGIAGAMAKSPPFKGDYPVGTGRAAAVAAATAWREARAVPVL